ncbi:MAG: T9SS type A sorting domain-containing protein, partial [Flavobacteriaceae bacterium]
IESFTALTDLKCQNNNLTTIDVTQNTALTRFWCLDNQLTSLDVSQNVLLDDFSCNNNLLTSLDVTNNTALTVFACRDNQITALDVSNNTLLEFFSCHTNQLGSLDVTQNTALVRLWCYNNLLTDLDLRNGNNTSIANGNFKAANNPNLTCINVEDTTWSTTNWTNIDAQTSFSENCGSTTSVSNFDLEKVFSIYPNPATNNFKIESDLAISKLTIFNHLGKEIAVFNSQESYDVSSLTDGIYFIQITSNNTTQLQKLIISSF